MRRHQSGYRQFAFEKAGGAIWLRGPGRSRGFYTSVQCVSPRHSSRVPGALAYDGVAAAGGLSKWISRTESRLGKWRFRGLGAWNHPLWRYREIPFTESLNLWKPMRAAGKLKPIFDPDWESQVEDRMARQVRSLRDAPMLIGYFLDNEIKWDPEWIFEYFDGRKPGDPNRRAVLEFLRRRHRTIGRLNRAWGTHLASFGHLAVLRRLPAGRDVIRPDAHAFLGLAARAFFRKSCGMLRKLDPERLILGVRYAGFPLDEVVAAQAGWTDAVSMNLYIQEGEFPAAQAERAHRLSGGQPVWITEFSWQAPFDNRSGNRNTIGFGSRVRLQKSRGRGYEKFVKGAASLSFMVGCDWFQWCDESPKGRGDGEDVNFGLVDVYDRPYAGLVERVARTNAAVNDLHSRARARPAPPRTGLRAPYALAGRLGASVDGRGNFAGAELGGLKFRPSLDPLPSRVPVRALIGWRPAGLRVEVDVLDAVRTVDLRKTKRSIEWFWMTDAVELLLRLGEETTDFLDGRALKLFAIPDGGGRGRPFVGSWRGRVRAFGPSTGAKVTQGRKRGGYRLIFNVPAGLLGVRRLKPWQVLRFNLLIEDCEKVREACWSAHQGDWTTERPGTWGRLVLVP